MNIKAELAHTRTLATEIERISKKKRKTDKDNKKAKEWKSELNDRIGVRLIEKLDYLSDGEKEMAKNYYYKGMSWVEAYAKSILFEEDETLNITSGYPMETHRKQIIRTLENYIDF